MDDISFLQSLLQQVQSTAPKKMLTERNAIDILEFLKANAALEIIPSQDGKEFMTPTALDAQVVELLSTTKKMRIAEISSALSVNSEAIEARLPVLTKTHGLIHVNGSVITTDYIRSLFQEIDDQLKTSKICSISGIAFKNEIESDFLVSLLRNPKYASFITTKNRIDFKTNTIFAEKYDSMMQRCLLGVTAGFKFPVAIDDVAKLVGLSRTQVTEYAQQLGLLTEGALLVSHSFADNRKKRILDFFQKNGSVEYSYLKKYFYLPKPKEYIESIFADKSEVIFLARSAISQTELMRVIVGVEQTLKCEGFANVEDLITFTFESEDVPVIMGYVLSEFQSQGLALEQESYYILLHKQRQIFAGIVEREVLATKTPLNEVTPEAVVRILVAQKVLEFQTDDQLIDFLGRAVIEKLDKNKIKAAAQSGKGSLSLKKDTSKGASKAPTKETRPTITLAKVKIPQVNERAGIVFGHYLLMDKYVRSLGKETGSEAQVFFQGHLRKMKQSALQTMIFAIEKKFGYNFSDSEMTDLEGPTDPKDVLAPPFKSQESCCKYWKGLPEDIRDVFSSEVSNDKAKTLADLKALDCAVFEEVDFDVVKLLHKKGTAITLGNYDTHSNKKSEKAYISSRVSAIVGWLHDNYLKEESGVVLSLLLTAILMRKGLVLFTHLEPSEVEYLVAFLRETEDEDWVALAEEVEGLFQEFETASENKEDTNTFFEEKLAAF